LTARAKELQLSEEYTALFIHVSRILPDELVNGPETNSLRRHDPVVMTGIINAPIKTGETRSHHQKSPRLATSINQVLYTQNVYRPNLPSLYVELDLGEDLMNGMDLIHKEYGRSIRQAVDPLLARTDSITFDPSVHQEFESNIRWGLCPVEFQDQITDIIQRHWDCFAEEGLKKHIRGFSCRIDTGSVAPVCCKPPRYGPHEIQVIIKLVEHLLANGLVESDYGPWGALIVLASKANQEDVP
jgi:hypothetical protein